MLEGFFTDNKITVEYVPSGDHSIRVSYVRVMDRLELELELGNSKDKR
jgi:hypothetical protein